MQKIHLCVLNSIKIKFSILCIWFEKNEFKSLSLLKRLEKNIGNNSFN